MFSFEKCIEMAAGAGHLSTEIVTRLAESPLYIQHHHQKVMQMPSANEWQTFKPLQEFQKILPAPITRTIQTSDALSGFRIYSILLSDGLHLIAEKFVAGDNSLLFVSQTCLIERILEEIRAPGQRVTLINRLYSLHPYVCEIPEKSSGLEEELKTLFISTSHFIFDTLGPQANYELSHPRKRDAGD